MDMKQTVAVAAGGLVLWFGWGAVNSLKKKRANNNLAAERIVAIVDSKHGILDKIDTLEVQTSISQDTFVSVKDAFDKLEKAAEGELNKPIHLVLHTFGGSLSAAEAIGRRILLARSRGTTIIAYVPYYAYSAGCIIAACCNEIRMTDSAFLGPADAQSGGRSINSIVQTVEFQKETCPKKIKPEWYADYLGALATRKRQLEWVEEMIKAGYFTEQVGNTIHEELFSGKYNHDQVVHPKRAIEIGLPVVIVEEMPLFVATTLRHFNARKA